MKIRELAPDDTRRELIRLERRVASVIRKQREMPRISKGLMAELQVRLKLLEECGFFGLKGPEGCVDIIAVKVEDNRIKFPLEAIGVEVLNFPLTRNTVQISNSKIRRKSGPFYVIFVETDPLEYSYLIYTHSEMRLKALGKGLYKEGKSREFSVPRKSIKEDKEYAEYLENWEKICKERQKQT